MNNWKKKVAVAAARGVIEAVRYALYILLLLLGRVLQPIADFVIIVGLVVFLFCLCMRPDMATPMWAGAGFAAAGTVILVFYEAALCLVAPANIVIVTDL